MTPPRTTLEVPQPGEPNGPGERQASEEEPTSEEELLGWTSVPARERPPPPRATPRTPGRRRARKPRDNRGWTPEMEALARREVQRAAGYAFMYEYMADSSSKCAKWLSLTTGIIGTVVGTSGFASIFVEVETPLWIRVVTALLGFIISIIAVIDNVFKVSGSQDTLVQNQVSYATLSKDILCQLAQPTTERADAGEYMKAKTGDIERIRLTAPMISARARAAYERKFQNNPIYSTEDIWEVTIADAARHTPAARERAERIDKAERRVRGSTSSSDGLGPSRTPSLEEIRTLVEEYEATNGGSDEKEADG